MSVRIFFHIVFLGFTILAISNAASLNSDEKQARDFAQKSSNQLFDILDELSNSHYYDDEYADKVKFFSELNENAKKFDYKNFKDLELKHAFERIVNKTEERGEPFFKIRKLINYNLHEEVLKNKTIEEYNKTSSNLLNYKDVKDIIETSNNPKELEFYWNKWREEISLWAKENLKLFLNMLKDLPDVSPLLRNYNFDELEKLMDEMKPLYTEIHAFIRDLLHTKYGDSVIKPDGLIPHHLFEQVMAQIWSPTNESVFEKSYPYKTLPTIRTTSLYYAPIALYRDYAADDFYKDIGFKPFSEEVWENLITEKPYYIEDEDADNYDVDCKARIYNSSPKIKLEYCKEIDYTRMLQAYEGLARLYYAQQMVGLPAYFFDSQNLEFAIGKAVVLSASTYYNIQKIRLKRRDFEVTPEVEIHRLLRKSIEVLSEIRLDFVHIKLIADLFLGNIELKDLNEKYWQLMEKYVGVGPPLNHKTGPDTFDMPVAFYDFIEYIFSNEDSRKIDTDILSYQIYQKLCDIAGKYPSKPLHLCYLNDSKLVGDALKKVMKLGSSKPFNDVLAELIPKSPKVKTDSILEYYSPIKKLLAEKNEKANLKLGW